MNNLLIEFLSMTALSLFFGFILGMLCTFVFTKEEIKGLEKEVDKFRDLYFEELDKWREK